MNDIAIDGLFSKSDLDNNVENHLSTFKIKKSHKSYKSTNWKRAYKGKSFKIGTKYEQNIFIKLGFIREYF